MKPELTRLTDQCGPHCGIKDGMIGHCYCGQLCHRDKPVCTRFCDFCTDLCVLQGSHRTHRCGIHIHTRKEGQR